MNSWASILMFLLMIDLLIVAGVLWFWRWSRFGQAYIDMLDEKSRLYMGALCPLCGRRLHPVGINLEGILFRCPRCKQAGRPVAYILCRTAISPEAPKDGEKAE